MDAQEPRGKSLNDLVADNEALRSKLLQYKDLEEDLAAQRIFEKAKKLLGGWVTFGGLFLSLASIVGFMGVDNYAKTLVAQKVNDLGSSDVQKYLHEEGQRQISSEVTSLQSELMDYAHSQIQAQLSPLGNVTTPTNGPPSAGATLDLSAEMLPVRQMGQEGSSVGFAAAAALEYQIRTHLHSEIRISPRYIYYYARVRANAPIQEDDGARIEDAVRILLVKGAVSEAAWPYVAGHFGDAPPDLRSTVHYKVREARPVTSLDGVRAALRSSGPVITGISLFNSGMTSAVAKTGVLPMPSASEQPLGGHAVCIVGYDDGRKLLKFINEWGPDWGDRGYGYIPYAYFSKYSSDDWTILI